MFNINLLMIIVFVQKINRIHEITDAAACFIWLQSKGKMSIKLHRNRHCRHHVSLRLRFLNSHRSPYHSGWPTSHLRQGRFYLKTSWSLSVHVSFGQEIIDIVHNLCVSRTVLQLKNVLDELTIFCQESLEIFKIHFSSVCSPFGYTFFLYLSYLWSQSFSLSSLAIFMRLNTSCSWLSFSSFSSSSNGIHF